MAGVALLSRPNPGHGPRAIARARVAQHYWAFISYSHDDEEVAEWLHEAIERFRVPPRLVGRLTDMGPVPRRLTPVFRDRHELAAADDLGDEIDEALAASRFLIVLCSPTAAQSRWTNSEIDSFKRRHPESNILAAIVAGEPFATEIKGRETEECFPPALRVRYDRRGRPTTKRAEPMAADLRDGGDGRRLGLLKLIAGMLGIGLDDLVQRETHRRQQRLMWLAAASIAGMAGTSGLALVAVHARNAATEQRREAEGLIGFMLGDLRAKLEPIGRLDALDAVGAKALAYYEKQDKGSLSDESLVQRSKALTLMGEMANLRGDLDGALERYREAMASTGETLKRHPDDPRRVFDHAQNVFWVGFIDWQHGNRGGAAAAFQRYKALADRMVALAPNNDDYRLEGIYADTNLGEVLIDGRHYRQAAEAFQTSLPAIEALAAKSPTNLDYQKQVVETLAYLSEARERTGDLEEAFAHRQRQVVLIARLGAAFGGDMNVHRKELPAHAALARLLFDRGQMQPAIAEADKATALSEMLLKREPSNTDWVQTATEAAFGKSEILLAAGRGEDAAKANAAACAAADQLVVKDDSVVTWRMTFRHRCLLNRAAIALRAGARDEAMDAARQALVLAREMSDPVNRGFAVARSQLVLGDALRAAGSVDAARGAFAAGVSSWPRGVEEKPGDQADHAVLLRRAGRSAEARPLIAQLSRMGFRRPDYLAAIKQGEST